MASLSVLSQYVFLKRHQTSVIKSVQAYCEELSRVLPANAPKFFPEIQNLLHVLSIDYPPSEFDNAVLLKIDVWTHGVYAMRDPRYFELKNLFSRLENCDSPLDLLFRGLFLARARRSHHQLVRVVLAAGVLVALVLLYARW